MKIMEKVQQGLVFDGGMGSMLIAGGLKGGESAEMWNITHPEVIQEVHLKYFNAGADVATVNTFGATPYKLKKMGINESAETINNAAISNARAVALPGQYIVGELGPLGEMFSPMGSMTQEMAMHTYSKQAEYLEAGGVDCFLLQTLFDLNEALAALGAVQAVTSKAVFCSLTFNQSKKGFFTLMGNSVKESMRRLQDAGAAAVGANCSVGSDTMIALAQEIRESVDIPVIIQPNAGMPETLSDGTVYYPEDASYYAENINKIKALGVEIVGGCCGTTPDYIRKIREFI